MSSISVQLYSVPDGVFDAAEALQHAKQVFGAVRGTSAFLAEQRHAL